MKEIWKDIVGYEGLYQVSNFGRIKRLVGWKCWKERIIKQYIHPSGYLFIQLCKNSVPKFFKVHKLLTIAFLGEMPKGLVTRHLDGNKKNNIITNLQYGTQSQNRNDAFKHGHAIPFIGSKHGMSKLTESKVKEIKIMLKDGIEGSKIALKYNIGQGTISNIKNNKNWTHVK